MKFLILTFLLWTLLAQLNSAFCMVQLSVNELDQLSSLLFFWYFYPKCEIFRAKSCASTLGIPKEHTFTYNPITCIICQYMIKRKTLRIQRKPNFVDVNSHFTNDAYLAWHLLLSFGCGRPDVVNSSTSSYCLTLA